MKYPKLTNCGRAAHSPGMTGVGKNPGRKLVAVMALLGTVPLAGCITLEAPDEPIVIELNINITQEVIYRLADDAENTIDENADIF